ncbi:hypothetical protein AMECASPLE_038047 [Ameca splendens]|uniref:Uncharacterized protein n=1 Tax=Ameca splendens TaxID=208324 RepID=A0ABV0Z859_9TELE
MSVARCLSCPDHHPPLAVLEKIPSNVRMIFGCWMVLTLRRSSPALLAPTILNSFASRLPRMTSWGTRPTILS